MTQALTKAERDTFKGTEQEAVKTGRRLTSGSPKRLVLGGFVARQ